MFWDRSDETPEQTAMLDAIVARATFPESRCESPGCAETGSVGKHPALFAFRITNSPKSAKNTYDTFCTGCVNEDEEAQGPNDCFMRELVYKGVLLCPCCTIAMAALIREDADPRVEWVVRPLCESKNDILSTFPTECKIASVRIMQRVDKHLGRSAAAAFGMDEAAAALGLDPDDILGSTQVTAFHAIPVTPELQKALEAGDRAEVIRIIMPHITAQAVKAIANDLVIKHKGKTLKAVKRRKRKPAISVDDVLDLADADIENKTLQDLGLQIPPEHEDN
jgi:hypothetical protein